MSGIEGEEEEGNIHVERSAIYRQSRVGEKWCRCMMEDCRLDELSGENEEVGVWEGFVNESKYQVVQRWCTGDALT